jgi:2-polyprenyl-3-methyl-5-hydroxy-6-metoxy-1,4-benzoquinol methylase
MNDQVVLNKYGFYELCNKPTKAELQEFYSQTYYQNPKGSYESKYSTEEIQYFNSQLERKFFLTKKYLGNQESNENLKFLDIGCGEGWALNFFNEKSWQVYGLDYSEYGCKQFNPELLKNVIIGDILENIKNLSGNELFDCILIDNVFEHVLDPLELLFDCFNLLKDKGVLIIEVPNDFSSIQLKLFEQQHISGKFWIDYPDHISYFNRNGLVKICNEAGLTEKLIMGDYPIDFNLFNTNTNYINDPTKGKSCHEERIMIENFLNDLSIEKTIAYYTALSDLGLGRQLVGFFQKNKLII